MKTFDVIDIVRKLVGPITPIGKTEADAERYINLEEMIDVVDQLLADIGNLSHFRHRPEASLRKAGERAEQFYEDLGIDD